MPVLVLVAAAVLQIVLLVHTRTVLTLAAGEGARVGALAGSSPAAATARAREVVSDALGLSPVSASAVRSVRAWREVESGMAMSVVQIEAQLSVAMLPFTAAVSVTGHQVLEEQPA